MTLAEKLVAEFESLPLEKQAEVIDFIEFLKEKEDRRIEDMMDKIISNNKEALLELGK
jgi:hypothetical protein